MYFAVVVIIASIVIVLIAYRVPSYCLYCPVLIAYHVSFANSDRSLFVQPCTLCGESLVNIADSNCCSTALPPADIYQIDWLSSD